MSRKPFYLSLRSGVWYAKIVDPKTGNQLSAVSTGQTDRDAAVLTVSRWLVEGIPQKRINSKKDVSEALTVNRLFNVPLASAIFNTQTQNRVFRYITG